MSNEMAVIEASVFGAMQEATKVCSFADSSRLEAEKNFAIQLLYKNDFSAKTARANPVSVQNALINLSAIGISLNPATKHAYLVPRDGAICLDISYMGLMHLAQEIGSILWGQAKIVYANDSYENQGLTKEPLHKANTFGDRGLKVGVYCTVKLPNGDFLTEEMSAEQIESVRQTSKAKDSAYSPWKTFEEEMWRKTVVKRASKYWPKSSARLDTAISVLNSHEGLPEENSVPNEWEGIKDKMLLISTEGTDIELAGFVDSHMVDFSDPDENHLVNWLHKQWPNRTKSKQAARIREGRKLINSYIEIFSGNEESEILEACEELTKLEFHIILKNMDKRGINADQAKEAYIQSTEHED